MNPSLGLGTSCQAAQVAAKPADASRLIAAGQATEGRHVTYSTFGRASVLVNGEP